MEEDRIFFEYVKELSGVVLERGQIEEFDDYDFRSQLSDVEINQLVDVFMTEEMK